MSRLKKEIVDLIESDTKLYGLVADTIGVKPTSLPMILNRNGNNLNQYSVVKAIADYLKRDAEDLVEATETAAQN